MGTPLLWGERGVWVERCGVLQNPLVSPYSATERERDSHTALQRCAGGYARDRYSSDCVGYESGSADRARRDAGRKMSAQILCVL